jgi:hypothetical protein
MWFGQRRALTNNLVELLASAHSTTEKLVDWMRIDAALVRYALRNGGDAELTVPDDNLRLLLAEQLAAILMAKENLMLLEGKNLYSPSGQSICQLTQKTSKNALPEFGPAYGLTVAIHDTSA